MLTRDYKNLKDLDYQPDQLQQSDQPQQSNQPQQSDKLKLRKWVKVSKKRFNEILSIVTEAKSNKLKTSVDKKSLLKGLINGKINGSEAKERYNKTVDDVDTILKARVTKNRKKNSGHFNTVKRNFYEG